MTTNADRIGARSSLARLLHPVVWRPVLRVLAASAVFALATQAAPSLAAGARLKYLNISGNTFTPAGDVTYARQSIGCVNQMPLNVELDAPVDLPQGAVVKSIALYTFDSTANAAKSVVQFLVNDNKGGLASTLSANSQPNVSGFQRNNSAPNPTTINNKRFSYAVGWRKDSAMDSTLLGLCGVRIAYVLPAP